MTLHLIKLSVGTESVETLEIWQRRRIAEAERIWGRPLTWHRTRMIPRRREELLEGGSIYWVIKGQIRARQNLLGILDQEEEDGRRACILQLAPELVRVEPRQHRAFQGWRYLKPEDAPRDLRDLPPGGEEMPEEMRAELRALGLL